MRISSKMEDKPIQLDPSVKSMCKQLTTGNANCEKATRLANILEKDMPIVNLSKYDT